MADAGRDGEGRHRASRPAIRIAAAAIRDIAGRQLLVRKRDTAIFMQAGGKIKSGETPFRALKRELREELGLSIGYRQARYLGLFEAEAAHEPGWLVSAHLFELVLTGEAEARREIEELLWWDARKPADVPLAPLTRRHVLRLDV